MALALVLVSAPFSCAPEPPAGATYNRPSKDDIFESTLVLTPSDDAALLEAMRDAVPGKGSAVAPARFGVRWADVQDAVRWGSNVAEMAVLTWRAEGDDCLIFEILTVADEPVMLTVRHVPPPTVVEMSAVAGLFGNRTDLEARLIHEVDAALRMFGRKPRPVHFDEPADESADESRSPS